MQRQPSGRFALAVLALALGGLTTGCDAGPPTAPHADRIDEIALARGGNGAYIEHGTFSFAAPPAPVNAPCVDPDNPLRVTGTWSGWYRLVLTANGHLHVTEHIDWSEVTIVAVDGRTWRPGPGAHESFSLRFDATVSPPTPRNIMHNLRARFLSQDGDSDLQVWHTIHVVVGPDGELRVERVVLPFEARCIGA